MAAVFGAASGSAAGAESREELVLAARRGAWVSVAAGVGTDALPDEQATMLMKDTRRAEPAIAKVASSKRKGVPRLCMAGPSMIRCR